MAYAQGLRPIRHADGTPWNGGAERCSVLVGYGTAVFVGDPVIAVGTGQIAITSGDVNEGVFTVVNVAAAGGVIYGVVVGIEPNRGDLSKQYLPASTGGTVMVARATPELIFTCGEDGTTDPLELVDLNSALDLATGAGGSTSTGYSSFVLDSDSHGSTAKQMYLRGLYNIPGNVDNVGGAGFDTIWEVSIMEIQHGQTPTGLGV